jgi:hypothetical protein
VTFSHQPITSGSPPLISFAQFQVSCGDGPVDYGDSVQFRHMSLRGGPNNPFAAAQAHPRPSLKVEQTDDAARMCCFDSHRGIALSGPIQRYHIRLGGVGRLRMS